MHFTEDEIYRASTQFRLWSFTPEQLASTRTETNAVAAARVKENVQRQREARGGKDIVSASASESEKTGSGTPNPSHVGAAAKKEVECLTVAEEKKLIDTFSEKAVELGLFLKFPLEAVATGVQYLKRFYLFNSPMSYEPQTITRSIMYMAGKTENIHQTAQKYAEQLSNCTAEQVLAPEYLIIQALRFTFDVKHPFRALRGGFLEMLSIAQGKGVAPESSGKSAQDMQADMLHLPLRPGAPDHRMTPQELQSRVEKAYTRASSILKTAAVLTDAYFLYTPAQIWLAAMLIADEVITLFYLSTKFPSTSDRTYTKLVGVVRACADLLKTHRSLSHPNLSKEETKAIDDQEQAEVKALIKKLRHCRDPDRLDLVKLNRAQKRDAVREDGVLEESKAKRRKLERETYEQEQEDFWGPELAKRTKDHNAMDDASK